MKSFDEGDVRRSDGASEFVDVALREFFVAELPTNLPPLPDRSPTDIRPVAAFTRRSGFAELLAYGALAASVLLVIVARYGLQNQPGVKAEVVVATKPSIERNKLPSPLQIAKASEASENLRPASFDPADFEYSVLERQDPVQTTHFVTSEGEFEQRINVQWKICSAYEPRTGERVQWSTPMVSITVIPSGRVSGVPPAARNPN